MTRIFPRSPRVHGRRVDESHAGFERRCELVSTCLRSVTSRMAADTGGCPPASEPRLLSHGDTGRARPFAGKDRRPCFSAESALRPARAEGDIVWHAQ